MVDTSLSSVAWSPVKLNDKDSLIKFKEIDNMLIFLYFDLSTVYKEDLDLITAQQRCSQLNDGIEMNVTKLFSTLMKVFTSIQNGSLKVLVEQSSDPNILIFKMKCPLSHMEFNWEIHLTKQSSDLVKCYFSLPILDYTRTLRAAVDLLFNEIKAKDREIEDFKLQGYSLRRKNLKTSKFNEDTWKAKISAPATIEEALKQTNFAKLFTDDVYVKSLETIVDHCHLQPKIKSETISDVNCPNIEASETELKQQPSDNGFPKQEIPIVKKKPRFMR